MASAEFVTVESDLLVRRELTPSEAVKLRDALDEALVAATAPDLSEHRLEASEDVVVKQKLRELRRLRRELRDHMEWKWGELTSEERLTWKPPYSEE